MKAKALALAIGLALAIPAGAFAAPPAQAPTAPYRNFHVAIYVTVQDTRRLADPAVFARDFARVSSQLNFDKVYIESYRDGIFADDAQLAAVKRAFEAKGIQTAGGVTLAAGGVGGQFGSFDYADPHDRAEAVRAVQLAARHFDTVILDDFFFFNRKTDLDIAAKGSKSWADYRMGAMREAARDLVVGAASAVNPHARVIIKYPNWYEHFHENGFDLAEEPPLFAGIYTGTETRDSEITDQLLQPYESYEAYRYFSNIAPGRNGGGWVDTYDIRAIDRYAEQLWDTMFAKAPEMTLFNWTAMADPKPAPAGDRPWSGTATSFRWPAAGADAGAGYATAANEALHEADAAVTGLGQPIGIASYRPPHATGEDFLHNYLGTVGLPIELYPSFPAQADLVLLTEAAKADPQIVEKIEGQLRAGKTVVVTSGLVRALQDKGLHAIADIDDTGRVAAIRTFFDGFAPGAGVALDDGNASRPAVIFPELHFYTNDSWPVIRGVASDKGFPILLMNRYSKGVLFVLNVPENMGDLYQLPQPLLTDIRRYLSADFPVRLDAPDHVALFAYDNGRFIVQNHRPTATRIGIMTKGAGGALRNLTSGETLAAVTAAPVAATRRPDPAGAPEARFETVLPPHSFAVFERAR